MIIKRSLRGQMPSLKRCRAEAIGEDDSEVATGCQKKKRRGDNYFPLELLGDLGAVLGLPFLPLELRRRFCGGERSLAAVESTWCTEVSFFPSEVDSEVRRAAPPPSSSPLPNTPVLLPPIVRTSRGRTQVLPSRFNDSVLIDPWKKDKPKSKGVSLNSALMRDYKNEKRDFCLACRNFSLKKLSTSRSTLTSPYESLVAAEERIPPPLDYFEDLWNSYHQRTYEELDLPKERAERRKDFFLPEDFGLGDVIWAKTGKRLWMGETGMLFPFIEYLDRFQGQTHLHKSKPSDLRMAIEEAFLAEHGFLGTEIDEMNMIGQMACAQTVSRGIHEATDSNHDLECQSQIQAR
ncbi:hypothetical protein HPP92_008738 [Vanilla planifolia]|uniref:Uncharacterized protein n=1 Tax=Vanilla planifolia TaxID=51239 RepID=A0A835V284_VANPL|nr:hypothetical protein HPP92_008738 [Vanilla planifolia]